MLPQREQTRSSSAMALPQALQYILCLLLVGTAIAGKMFLDKDWGVAHFFRTVYSSPTRGRTHFSRFLARKPALTVAERVRAFNPPRHYTSPASLPRTPTR